LSNPVFKFKVSSVDEDRYGWVRVASLGQRKLLTPVFLTLIKGESDFETYIDFMNTYKVDHLGACIIPIIFARSTTEQKIAKLKELKKQNRLEGGLASESLENFFDKTLVAIDPYTEYPHFEFEATLLKMSTSLAIPDSYRELATRIYDFGQENKGDKKAVISFAERNYVDFYLGLKSDPAKRTTFVKDFMNSESARGASIGIPSVPFVSYKYKDDLLDILKELTRISKALWKGGECLTYIPLEQRCLSDAEFMDRIASYIETEESHYAIKVKNFDLIRSDAMTRESFFAFETRLQRYRKEKSKLGILLEAGPQAIPCSIYGFDMVSTSLRALDRDGAFGRSDAKGRGGYYDPVWLMVRPYKEIKQVFINRGNKLPCSCAVCKSITDLDALTKDFWNSARRKHLLLTMNALMTEFTLNVKDRRIDLSYDRIVKSELCPLKRIIPPH